MAAKPHFVALSFCRFGALWKSTKRTNDKTNKKPRKIKLWYFAVTLSFRRALTNATKRTNREMKFHIFVLATCTTRQNEQTKKWNSISSFWRLVQRDKTNKRRNEILFWRSFVCSFSRLDQRDKTNKRRNEIPFLRFGDLYNATKRANEETKLCFGVLSFVRVKKSYLILYSQLILKYSDDLSWFTVRHLLYLEKCVITFSNLIKPDKKVLNQFNVLFCM